MFVAAAARSSSTATPAPAQNLAGILERVRILCTVYDPRAGKYRLNYGLFIEILVGLSVLGATAWYVGNEWRRQRACARRSRGPVGADRVRRRGMPRAGSSDARHLMHIMSPAPAAKVSQSGFPPASALLPPSVAGSFLPARCASPLREGGGRGRCGDAPRPPAFTRIAPAIDMLKLIQRAGQKAFHAAEGLFNQVFGDALNPFYYLGAIAYYLLWVVVASGLYLYIFFETGVTRGLRFGRDADARPVVARRHPAQLPPLRLRRDGAGDGAAPRAPLHLRPLPELPLVLVGERA